MFRSEQVPEQSEYRSFVASTRFEGCVVRCDFPRSMVARILPTRLSLHTAPRCARDRHPVVFIFGRHDRSAVLFASLTVETGVRFHEMVVGIPFVRSPFDAAPALWLPRVFSTEPVVTWSGNAHYAYAKRMVPLEWLGDTFVVSDEGGALLAHLVVEPSGEWEHAPTSRLTAFAMALGRMPVLGARDGGDIVRSYFDWGFGDAWVRPLRARVSIDRPLGRGLEAGEHHGTPTGCVEVSGLSWRLSWPEA
jgi:hypothetical protein